MLYVLNLLFSCLYLRFLKYTKYIIPFIFSVLPVILIWTLIVGGQDNIGADYKVYYSFFSFPNFDSRFEPLFSYISYYLHNIGFSSQGPFFFFALLNVVVIFVAAHRIEFKHLALFYFLLITVSTFFNNQMNGLRQCIAVTFIFWAYSESYNSKVKALLLILIAAGFHYTALVCLFLLPIKTISFTTTKYPRLLLIISVCILFIPFGDSLITKLFSILPSAIREATLYESMYGDSDSSSIQMGIIYKLSKVMLLPVYWYALKLLDEDVLSPKELLFFKFGLLSYCLKCALLINQLIARFSYYFWIPSIIPIYYLCVHYYKKKDYVRVFIILFYCSFSYFVKIILGQNEYKSSFIYFN